MYCFATGNIIYSGQVESRLRAAVGLKDRKHDIQSLVGKYAERSRVL